MKEVELGTEDENYEVIPLSPIRRLEERIKKLEKEREGFAYQGFMREILDLIQSNQKLVDEIVKANDQLRDELAKIPGKIDELLQAWREFIDVLKEASGTETNVSSLNEKFDELIEQNKEMIEAIKSIKRTHIDTNLPMRYPKIRIKRT
ncbi:MAG: hypothetical protein J7K87_02245 [Candidatus Aenigmarchaeota archaeon]|nr:hypothetical protein [Candidatus Aenigmarchaeota archaeon]